MQRSIAELWLMPSDCAAGPPGNMVSGGKKAESRAFSIRMGGSAVTFEALKVRGTIARELLVPTDAPWAQATGPFSSSATSRMNGSDGSFNEACGQILSTISDTCRDIHTSNGASADIGRRGWPGLRSRWVPHPSELLLTMHSSFLPK